MHTRKKKFTILKPHHSNEDSSVHGSDGNPYRTLLMPLPMPKDTDSSDYVTLGFLAV